MASGSSSNPDQIAVTDLPGGGQAPADNVPRAGGPALKDADIPATIARTSALAGKVSTGGALVVVTSVSSLTFSAAPTQAECNALRDAVASMLATLRVHG
jgi:hypothetical protein